MAHLPPYRDEHWVESYPRITEHSTREEILVHQQGDCEREILLLESRMRYLRLELQRISPELRRIRQEREAQERQQQARLHDQQPDVPRTPPRSQVRLAGPPPVVRHGPGLRRTDSARYQAVDPPNNNNARSGTQTALFSRPRMKF